MTDQPETCPMCGYRSEFEEIPKSKIQHHKCNRCEIEWLLSDDPDTWHSFTIQGTNLSEVQCNLIQSEFRTMLASLQINGIEMEPLSNGSTVFTDSGKI